MTRAWTEYITLRLKGEEKNIPWWVNDKFKLSKFCKENNLPHPKIENIWKHPENIDLDVDMDEFVLKPSVMFSAKGVMVLKKTSDSEIFYESLSDKYMSRDQIISEQIQVYEACKYKSSYHIFIEEKLVDENVDYSIPLDYKIFCFYGVPKLVAQYDRNSSKPKTAWFDGDFRPLILKNCINSDWKYLQRGEHVLPSDWQDMLSIAIDITKLLETPFMRVDMYSTTRGPVIGELTPAPGGAYYRKTYEFTEQFDLALGKAWHEAQILIDSLK